MARTILDRPWRWENSSTIYKKKPNLVAEGSFFAEKDFPWPCQLIKIFKPRGFQSFVLDPLKTSKALKSYLAASHLVKHDLLTPIPLAAFEHRKLGLTWKNAFICESIPHHVVLRAFLKENWSRPGVMEEVLQKLAGFVLKMHDSGFWHRDMNLSNFLLTGGPGKYSLYVIDLNRARIRPELSLVPRALDLARLDLDEWQDFFFRAYCGERFDVDRMLLVANLARKRRRIWRRMVAWTKPMRGG